MIELLDDELVFRFPEVHEKARLDIALQRTFRIPDDGKEYPLPPGFSNFPLRHVDDFAENVPEGWLKRGGVILPMYQSEALWIDFTSRSVPGHGAPWPFAVKVAAGKINALTGKPWAEGLEREPQNYASVPEQPWLDGYCVERGLIRQFVAMPLGAGYSAEEQITGKAEFGGLQIQVFPMKREVFERRFPKRKYPVPGEEMLSDWFADDNEECCLCLGDDDEPEGGAMALAPGGLMRQKIYDDPFDFSDWDTEHSSRCFLHLANSLLWRQITGEEPPPTPMTAQEYEKHGLPWFEAYNENAAAISGSKTLQGLKSVAEMAKAKGDKPLPENKSVMPGKVVGLRVGLGKHQVREEEF